MSLKSIAWMRLASYPGSNYAGYEARMRRAIYTRFPYQVCKVYMLLTALIIIGDTHMHGNQK